MAVFFWRRTTTPAAITSIILGTAITVGWQLIQQIGPARIQAQISDIDAVYPALAASIISLIVVSLLTRSSSTATLKELESA